MYLILNYIISIYLHVDIKTEKKNIYYYIRVL